MAVATKAFFDMTNDNQTTEAFLFGDACYNVSGPLSEISNQWEMYQLSYGDTDPVLSDRDKFPNFFRIVPSDSDFNPARLAILKHFNWSIVGTLFQDASHGSARYGYAHNRFDTMVENSKINITKVESFADDPDIAIQNLKDRDVRVIVGNFDEDMARMVFCSARQKGMYGPRYQWIILGTYSAHWWKQGANCSVEELEETLHGYLATDILPLSSDEELTESGRTPEEYRLLYESERGEEYSVYHGYAYDGIWVIARALERLLADDYEDLLDDMSLTALERRLRGSHVGKALNDTNIRGVTGRVQFNNGDRLGIINILQMQAGKVVKVAEYNALTEQLDFNKGSKIVWWKDDKPPKDRTVQYEEFRHVSTPVYLSLVALASTGIFMACCFLGLNIHFRRHRFIKMSSPNMNNVIIVGCILCYFSIILLGTDGSVASVSPEFFPYWCRARAWVLSLGFTLAFGAMFSKTWRVHAIFTNIKLNRKVIKDYKLILVVMVLVMLDVALLVAWQVVDPFRRAEKWLVPEVHEDFEMIPKLEFCSSRHMEIWMGSIYAYKGLLLAFGCFLAWETRQVSIPALNDSKYIGMSVYNVVIMCTCGAAVTFLIQDQPTHSFLILAVFILFATTATLCLVFVPKIIQLRRDPKGEDQRIRATLRKPARRGSEEDDHFQHKLRLASEENRRLRIYLEQKAAELEQLLEQLGEEACQQELAMKNVIHKQVLALRSSTDNSPSKTSRVSSDLDGVSTYSEISAATTTVYVTDSPPGGGSRSVKSRLLNNRMRSESIELVDIKGKKRRKSSVTIPPQAEEEEEDDPFGGVYLGPPDPPPVRKKPTADLFPPRNPNCPPPGGAKSDSVVPNSCNNTLHHEPPTLGVTSCSQTVTAEVPHVSELLMTWPEEDGEVHYSKTPSVLLLQAGQQSHLGAAAGRQARGKRPASGPLSIWTIAEVGEEDHSPREGRSISSRVEDEQVTPVPGGQNLEYHSDDGQGGTGHDGGGFSGEQTVDSCSPRVREGVNIVAQGGHLADSSQGERIQNVHENSPPEKPEPTSEQSCLDMDNSSGSTADNDSNLMFGAVHPESQPIDCNKEIPTSSSSSQKTISQDIHNTSCPLQDKDLSTNSMHDRSQDTACVRSSESTPDDFNTATADVLTQNRHAGLKTVTHSALVLSAQALSALQIQLNETDERPLHADTGLPGETPSRQPHIHQGQFSKEQTNSPDIPKQDNSLVFGYLPQIQRVKTSVSDNLKDARTIRESPVTSKDYAESVAFPLTAGGNTGTEDTGIVGQFQTDGLEGELGTTAFSTNTDTECQALGYLQSADAFPTCSQELNTSRLKDKDSPDIETSDNSLTSCMQQPVLSRNNQQVKQQETSLSIETVSKEPPQPSEGCSHTETDKRVEQISSSVSQSESHLEGCQHFENTGEQVSNSADMGMSFSDTGRVREDVEDIGTRSSVVNSRSLQCPYCIPRDQSRDDSVPHVFHSYLGQSDSNVSHHGGLKNTLDLTSPETQSTQADTRNTVELSQTDNSCADIGVPTESDTCSFRLSKVDSETSLHISGLFKMSTDSERAFDNEKYGPANVGSTSVVTKGSEDRTALGTEDNNQQLLMSSKQFQTVPSVKDNQTSGTATVVGGQIPEISNITDISEEAAAPTRGTSATDTEISADTKVDTLATRRESGSDHMTTEIFANTDISTLESAVKKGVKAGGGAQVYPEHPGESSHQTQSVCSSQEELWACPPTSSSSPLPSSSPARIRFSCDIIEKF